MNRKLILLCLLAFYLTNSLFSQKIKDIYSPDRNTKLSITVSDKISFEVAYKNQPIVSPSNIDLVLTDGRQLSRPKGYRKVSTKSNNTVIVSPVPEKRVNIPDIYNEARIDFKSPFSITFRVYNDGVAYRISSSIKDSIIVKNEIAQFNFPSSSILYSEVQGGRTDRYHTSFEENYLNKPLDSITEKNLLFNPAVIIPSSGPKIAITESDVDDYPGMFLTGNGANTVSAVFAPYPKTEKAAMAEYSQIVAAEREDFIAKTKGTRNFPWRILMTAEHDKDLPANDLVYRLASPSTLSDPSWIFPSQSTDEWIINTNLFNVDFKSGINTNTYKYYIDFAAKFGIESVMMDAGWSDNNDLFKINPNINMEEILGYAKSKGVKINMWTLGMTLDKQLEPALDRFNKWGVNFIMTDFFDRDDQVSMNRIKRIAEACGRHKIMIMFHGAPKPSGFNRTYPHAITREGVLGSEFNIWSDRVTPTHNVTLPFTRQLAGPFDYEPGLLNNGTAKSFRPIEGHVMSNGTRTNQLAMYVVYESPIQFFSGNPSQGMLEPEFMSLLGSIPTVWDTTVIVDAQISKFIITARKKGGDWYIGAMTDSVARDFSISLDFIGDGKYNATICEDGINADRYASDYKISSRVVTSKEKLSFTMQPGGGYVVRLIKK
ncbi:MAG: glycoside hydrolase family 97 protein [Chitinophagaceae bacterium]|nr:glycoside hydrolase family 97 protein [Chitinophagaceae bacterium]